MIDFEGLEKQTERCERSLTSLPVWNVVKASWEQ